jgi:hypothetical protein
LRVAAVDVDDPLGRDLRVYQAEFLALVDERGAAQRVQHQPDRAGPRGALPVYQTVLTRDR